MGGEQEQPRRSAALPERDQERPRGSVGLPRSRATAAGRQRGPSSAGRAGVWCVGIARGFQLGCDQRLRFDCTLIRRFAPPTPASAPACALALGGFAATTGYRPKGGFAAATGWRPNAGSRLSPLESPAHPGGEGKQEQPRGGAGLPEHETLYPAPAPLAGEGFERGVLGSGSRGVLVVLRLRPCGPTLWMNEVWWGWG